MKIIIVCLLCMAACAYGDVEIYTPPPTEDASVPPNTGYNPGDQFETDAAVAASNQSGYHQGDILQK
jgi:hypothetical protein